MDSIALQTLFQEMQEDCRVALDACEKAKARYDLRQEIAYEACAHQLCRMDIRSSFRHLSLQTES